VSSIAAWQRAQRRANDRMVIEAREAASTEHPAASDEHGPRAA
jgi:hypothetical protein